MAKRDDIAMQSQRWERAFDGWLAGRMRVRTRERREARAKKRATSAEPATPDSGSRRPAT
jgi:hypothetical protein